MSESQGSEPQDRPPWSLDKPASTGWEPTPPPEPSPTGWQPPPAPEAPPPYQPPAPPGSYGAPSYGPPPYNPPTYGYGYGSPYSYGSSVSTNGKAVAALICGIAGIVFCPVVGIAGLVLGLMARREIRESGGTQSGDGLALAGVIIGGITLALVVLSVLIIVFALAAQPGTF